MSNVNVINPRSSVAPAEVFPRSEPQKGRERIGELLVARGVMTAEQIDLVLAEQRGSDERFGEIAVRLGFASRSDVLRALEEHFGYSTAVAVADSRLSRPLLEALSPLTSFAEGVRALRSQLKLRWFDGTPGRSAVAVTSVDRGDGKSFITANLGVAFSQLGDRTLIIDADLRHASQDKLFGLRNRLGLSGMLSGRAGFEEITTVKEFPDLAILPSGPLPPNPQELLSRAAFPKLLNELASRFDVILVDTPSAQQAADGLVTAKRAGACLIVGRKDKTRSANIVKLATIFSDSGIEVLGAIFNEH